MMVIYSELTPRSAVESQLEAPRKPDCVEDFSSCVIMLLK